MFTETMLLTIYADAKANRGMREKTTQREGGQS